MRNTLDHLIDALALLDELSGQEHSLEISQHCTAVWDGRGMSTDFASMELALDHIKQLTKEYQNGKAQTVPCRANHTG